MLPADLSRKFQEVLAAYLEAREKGEAVDPEALVRAHPELAEELREFFANEQQLAGVGLQAPEPEVRVSNKVRTSQIGEYELLGEIARGGMGVVHRARHTSLRRLVALKMLLGGEFAGPDGLQRFRTEAEVVAGLDHPYIVPIYDFGVHEEQAFFCMKLIDGPSLKQKVSWFRGKSELAVRLLIQITRAVRHAHQRGILHRDLKPGNILLELVAQPTRAKNTILPFLAYVTDFGLAKRFKVDGKASHSTAVVGTAAYMAPEQATGGQALTVAADVYSLGAILYELLAGRPPFTGQNPLEILLQVVEKEAPSPSTLLPGLDDDLCQICLKCLRKNPEQRYPSAEALAVELENWLEGEPLTVRAPTVTERLWHMVRRHPSASLIVLLLLTVAIGSTWISWHLNDTNEKLLAATEQAGKQEALAEERARSAEEALELARQSAERERQARIETEQAVAVNNLISLKEEQARQAERTALEESRRLLVQHYVGNGEQLLQRNDLHGAALWFAEALRQDQGHPQREPLHRIRLGTTWRQCPPLAQMWYLDEKARLLRLSPVGYRLLTVGKSSPALLWDTNTGKAVGQPLSHDGTITAAEFCPSGKWIVTVGTDGHARLWSALTGQPQGALKHAQTIHSAAFSSDSKFLATACADKIVRIWDVGTAKFTGKTLIHDQEVRSAVFHPDGKKLLTISENMKNRKGELRVWDIAKNTYTALSWNAKKPKSAPPGINAAGYSKDGKRIYAIASDQTVHRWDASGKAESLPAGLYARQEQGWFSPALDRFVQQGEAEVRIVGLPGGGVHSLRPEGTVSLAQFSPNGRFVLIATNRGVRLWRTDEQTWIAPTLPSAQAIAAVRFSSNDQWLAIATEDRFVRLWHLTWSERDQSLALAKNKLLSVSPDGKTALLAQNNTLLFWDIEQDRQTGATISLANPTVQTRWSPDGRTLAIATRNEIRLWDALAGKLLTPVLKDQEISRLQFSPQGKELIVWSKNKLHCYDLAGKSLAGTKINMTAQVHDCDGKRLAVWKKNTFEIQEMHNKKVQPLLKLDVVPAHFRFSPNRQFGVVVFADGSLRIWDLFQKRTPVTPPFGPGEAMRQIVFSSDGRFLASAGASGMVRVWDAATGEALAPAFALAGSLVDMTFRHDGEALLAWTTDGRLHRWNLRGQSGDAENLIQQIQLAASQEIHANSGSLIALEPAVLHQRWLKYRER